MVHIIVLHQWYHLFRLYLLGFAPAVCRCSVKHGSFVSVPCSAAVWQQLAYPAPVSADARVVSSVTSRTVAFKAIPSALLLLGQGGFGASMHACMHACMTNTMFTSLCCGGAMHDGALL
jgi:hypothetical protein